MSKKIAFCSLMAVLGVLSMLVTAVLPTNTVFFFLFSTLFTYICVEEHGIRYGILTYAVITIISFLILPQKVSVAFYAMAVGYYPALKCRFERLDCSKAAKWSLKILFVLAAAAISYFILKGFVAVKLPILLLFLFGTVLFVIYDLALTYGLRFYVFRLRKNR